MLVDSAEDLSCWEMPEGDTNLYTHFLNRSVSDGPQPPFPLQAILAPDGTVAYVSREHIPDKVLEILESLVTPHTGRGAPATPEASP